MYWLFIFDGDEWRWAGFCQDSGLAANLAAHIDNCEYLAW